MITIATVPKAFEGHVATIQHNAIRSWTKLGDKVEIILFGRDEGIREFAEEYSVRHIPDIDYNEYGTPVLSSVFSALATEAAHNRICFVNSDIIFLSDFTRIVEKRNLIDCFLVGKRTNIDLVNVLDFEDEQWRERLARDIEARGFLQNANAIDYFIFPKKTELLAIPPFLVGRPAWDNWFLRHALSCGYRLVDITSGLTCIHQNHDYRHVKNRRGNSWDGPEGDWNRQLAGNNGGLASIYDSNYTYWNGLVLPSLGCRYMERRFRRWMSRDRF